MATDPYKICKVGSITQKISWTMAEQSPTKNYQIQVTEDPQTKGIYQVCLGIYHGYWFQYH